jgi:predicted GH43/DUF377 family glycosyl hydrolase
VEVVLCVSVLKGDDLYVYYGGADEVICVATLEFKCLVDALEDQKSR